MWKGVKLGISIMAFVAMVVGLASTPDDLENWGSWFKMFGSLLFPDLARTGLIIGGAVLIIAINLPGRLWRKFTSIPEYIKWVWLSGTEKRSEKLRRRLRSLSSLRAEGVAIRNNGRYAAIDDEWFQRFRDWESQTRTEVGKLSVVDASYFDTLNEFEANPEDRVKSIYLAILTEKLKRLEEIMRRHDPDAGVGTADVPAEAQILVNVSGPPETKMEQLDLVGSMRHGASHRWVVPVPYEVKATRSTHMDKLQLVVGKEHFDELHPFNRSLSQDVAVSGEAIFHLPIDLPIDSYRVMLVACSEGKEWGSSEFSLELRG